MATYQIKSGDTLSKIAAQNGTTVAALAAANGIADPNKIKAGQTITIPAARTVTTTPTTTPAKTTTTTTPAPKTTTTSTSSAKKVIGQYQGYDIYSGTDADIQAQQREIDSKVRGGNTSTPTTTSQAPDVGGIYASVIGSNPVLADMLKDPATKAQYDALTPDLQGIFLQTAQSLGKAITDGKVVNPNIELTPAENQKLIDQAHSELDPYYQEQLGLLKGDFTTSISRLMEDYNTATGREGAKFKNTLDTNAESEAGAGTTYSSGRVDRENQAVTTEQQALDDAALGATRSATDTAKAYEGKVGSSAIRSLNIPSLTTYSATNTGLNTGGSRNLYDTNGNIALGTVAKDQTTAEQQRRSQLETAFRASRQLDLSALS